MLGLVPVKVGPSGAPLIACRFDTFPGGLE
jgi:hypothetical protein